MRSIALASILAFAPVAALAATLGVPLDHTILVSLSGPAHNIFIGNPTVADVVLADPHHLALTGKSGGVTNLIITDERGRLIFNREIVVGAYAGDHISLINGGTVVSYACAPSCEQIGQVQAMPASPQTTTSASSVAQGASGSNSWTLTQSAAAVSPTR